MNDSDRRLIEEALPLKEISFEAAREKSIRHGHISTLHIWWARRPLVACRAALIATLLEKPTDVKEREKLLQFITRFCTWEASNDSTLIDEATKMILSEYDGKPPRILDCFGGAGTIALEALRVGCEAHSLELNPVAILIELCTLVYPERYGKPFELSSNQTNIQGERKRTVPNRLANDVLQWGHWVRNEVWNEIGQFYPIDKDGSVTVAYLWCRTAKCPNPRCGAEIPLLRSLWLTKKEAAEAALRITVDRKSKTIGFELVAGEPRDFDPEKGTMKKGSAKCPVCKEGALKSRDLRKLAMSGNMGSRLLAVILSKEGKQGKKFRLARKADLEEFEKAKAHLAERRRQAKAAFTPPDELIVTPDGAVKRGESLTFFVHLQPVIYGMLSWGDLFSARQALALLSFSAKLKDAYNNIVAQTHDQEYAKAVVTYLGLAVDRLADYMSTLTIWSGDFIAHTFGRQAIGIVWDYPELNPFSHTTGNWSGALNWIVRVIDSLSTIQSIARVQHGTATRLPYPDAYFDAIVTDPPYYDAVPYSDLSDFFYVWLKRSIGFLYPELFSTPLSPKTQEIIQNSSLVRRGGLLSRGPESRSDLIKDQAFFEREMTKAFSEMNRVLKANGMCTIVFAHKTIGAWETLIRALLQAGFAVTSSWPLRTERPGRLRAHGSAALASSVWLVCRKRQPYAGTGSWKSVHAELDRRVKERLEFFLSQGIKGADALLSAIGPALEVFGKYEKVEKVTGDAVSIADFLDKIREVVAHHALSTVLSEHELGNVDPPTAFYVLWKWTFEPSGQNGRQSNSGGKSKGNTNHILVPYDDALKLARSVGAAPESLLKTHVLKQEKENIRLLGPSERKHVSGLGETARDGTPPATIDMIHRTLNLWAAMEHAQLEEYLEKSGAKKNETFWRVAQALSNLLPLQSREKQLLDGLLARHAGGAEAVRPREVRSLDEFVKKEEKE